MGSAVPPHRKSVVLTPERGWQPLMHSPGEGVGKAQKARASFGKGREYPIRLPSRPTIVARQTV